jgi:NAD(P)-dependent dehydrogenase (short-subunit alcohol dehydrogenase family)
MSRFPDAAVVVSGGGRGIGKRIAERFEVEGARVVVLDLHPGVDGIVTDVGDAQSVAAAFAEALSRLGTIDVLVNSAGVLHLASLLDTSVEDWQRVMSVNAFGTFALMQAAGRQMVEQGRGGRIINIASMAAKKGGGGEAAYAASKSAVVALTRAAALEWGPHQITANAICPGYIPTEMGASTRTEADIALWSSYSPLGRLGTTDDVASLALFLASENGAYMTGQALNVTGGMVMH